MTAATHVVSGGMEGAGPARFWGQHLIIDLQGCEVAALKDADNIRAFVKELVKEIDMVAYKDTMLEHFASHSFEAAGYSMMQFIETSAISAHFAENLGEIYLDIFSCKGFDNAKALAVCRKYFKPKTVTPTVIWRGVKP